MVIIYSERERMSTNYNGEWLTNNINHPQVVIAIIGIFMTVCLFACERLTGDHLHQSSPNFTTLLVYVWNRNCKFLGYLGQDQVRYKLKFRNQFCSHCALLALGLKSNANTCYQLPIRYTRHGHLILRSSLIYHK